MLSLEFSNFSEQADAEDIGEERVILPYRFEPYSESDEVDLDLSDTENRDNIPVGEYHAPWSGYWTLTKHSGINFQVYS